MRNNEKRWFALKDKTLRTRAKGTFPQIQLEFELFWNPLQATYVTLNPRKEQHFKPVDKFKRQVFVNNVMRIKEVILAILDFIGFIKSCLEWEGQASHLSSIIVHLNENFSLLSSSTISRCSQVSRSLHHLYDCHLLLRALHGSYRFTSFLPKTLSRHEVSYPVPNAITTKHCTF